MRIRGDLSFDHFGPAKVAEMPRLSPPHSKPLFRPLSERTQLSTSKQHSQCRVTRLYRSNAGDRCSIQLYVAACEADQHTLITLNEIRMARVPSARTPKALAPASHSIPPCSPPSTTSSDCSRKKMRASRLIRSHSARTHNSTTPSAHHWQSTHNVIRCCWRGKMSTNRNGISSTSDTRTTSLASIPISPRDIPSR